MILPPQDRVIVALDVDDVRTAEALVERLGETVTHYKIGYQLVFGGGLDFARHLASSGHKIFLDMKLHDIANTVEKGVARIADLGVTWLTVHAYPQTLMAAVKGAAGTPLRILGVTVLTSWDKADVAAAGFSDDPAALVQRRARQAVEAGAHGLILSPEELVETRARFGKTLELITPGIRPAGGDSGDQKRIATPSAALAAGADRLVIGRPITAASDPRSAAQSILDEIAALPMA